MSAIDDIPDDRPWTELERDIDFMWPDCSLCSDTGRMDNFTYCICVGWVRETYQGKSISMMILDDIVDKPVPPHVKGYLEFFADYFEYKKDDNNQQDY